MHDLPGMQSFLGFKKQVEHYLPVGVRAVFYSFGDDQDLALFEATVRPSPNSIGKVPWNTLNNSASF